MTDATYPKLPEELMEDWLFAVNQPVCDNGTNLLDEALDIVSDGGNFSKEQCKIILLEILKQCPTT